MQPAKASVRWRAVVCVLPLAAAVLALVACTGGAQRSGAAGATDTASAPPPAMPTPPPRKWRELLRANDGAREELIACHDADGNARIDGADAPELAGVAIDLVPNACPYSGDGGSVPGGRRVRADSLQGAPTDAAAYACAADQRPVLLMAFVSAGSDLLDASSGESLGVLDIINALQARLSERGVASRASIYASAVFDAPAPQTAMEQWGELALRREMDALPCLRAVVIGHSHGGATVTTVTAALDAAYGDRVFGVLLDRTIVLYDRFATDWPARTPLLNIFQTNEGWHGEAVGFPDVTDVDASAEQAPVAPSDGGGGPAPVTHKTLDDAPAVQARVVDAVLGWLGAP